MNRYMTLILFSCVGLISFCIHACKAKPSEEKKKTNTVTTGTNGVGNKTSEELLKKKNNNEAIQKIDKLLLSQRNNPPLLLQKAELQINNGDTSAAIQSLQQAIAAAGVYPEASLQLAYLYAYQQRAEALTVCDGLLKETLAENRRSEILFIKSLYYIHTANNSQALTILDQIIKENYTYLDAYIEKGLIYYDQKKYTEALKIFELSTTIRNSFAEGYYWMARCEEKLNRKADAIDNYKIAIVLNPNYTEAREDLARLETEQ